LPQQKIRERSWRETLDRHERSPQGGREELAHGGFSFPHFLFAAEKESGFQ